MIVLLGRNLEEDAAGVFPGYVLELLLLATYALCLVVGLAGSSFNYLDGGEFTSVVIFSLS
jgi:hypothetical protein